MHKDGWTRRFNAALFVIMKPGNNSNIHHKVKQYTVKYMKST